MLRSLMKNNELLRIKKNQLLIQFILGVIKPKLKSAISNNKKCSSFK
jgi:hypothetical protein